MTFAAQVIANNFELESKYPADTVEICHQNRVIFLAYLCTFSSILLRKLKSRLDIAFRDLINFCRLILEL